MFSLKFEGFYNVFRLIFIYLFFKSEIIENNVPRMEMMEIPMDLKQFIFKFLLDPNHRKCLGVLKSQK